MRVDNIRPQSPSSVATPRRFRWQRLVQFRLRTLLILMAIVAVWFAGWSYEARQQAKAVAALEKSGLVVFYAGPPVYCPDRVVAVMGIDYFAGVEHVAAKDQFVKESRIPEDVFEHFRELRGLRELDLRDMNTTDSAMQRLGHIPSVTTLWLCQSRVTDAGVKHIEQLTSLEELSLDDTETTDAGLQHLKGQSRLTFLSLDGTKVTDVGLENLQGLSNLTLLSLVNTRITDAGLEKLRGLSKLKSLYVYHTKVTEAGKQRLKKALPNCDMEPQINPP